MLNSIKFENYKAFEKAVIDLKPITILLGTNSSGKSSILQSILLFEQSLNSDSKYDSALKLNGKFVNLGETSNIFRSGNIKNNLKFAFEIDPTIDPSFLINIKRLVKHIKESIIRIHYELRRIGSIKGFDIDVDYRNRNVSNNFNDLNVNYLIKEIKKIQNIVKDKSLKPDLFGSKTADNSSLSSLGISARALHIDITNFKRALDFIDAILKNSTLNPFELRYEFKYSEKDKAINVVKYSICQSNKRFIELELKNSKGQQKYKLVSDIYSNSILSKHREQFGQYNEFINLSLSNKSDIESDFPSPGRLNHHNILSTTIVRVCNRYQRYLEKAFESDRINYISPLRAFPKRYYFLDSSRISSSLDSIDGDNLTEILKKEEKVKNSVNQWLSKFGLSVNVEDLKEVIHRLKVSQNGLSLDITDVGFGISQVLPIIIQGFMSKTNSLTIIEQPEIHLHPKMQAELADLFIDVIKTDDSKSKTLLIETHSESILKRLRRRIAEGHISADDVSIYYIHSSKGKTGAVAEKLEISKTGAFDWPVEFYTTDYEDTAAFLKLQKNA